MLQREGERLGDAQARLEEEANEQPVALPLPRGGDRGDERAHLLGREVGNDRLRPVERRVPRDQGVCT